MSERLAFTYLGGTPPPGKPGKTKKNCAETPPEENQEISDENKNLGLGRPLFENINSYEQVLYCCVVLLQYEVCKPLDFRGESGRNCANYWTI